MATGFQPSHFHRPENYLQSPLAIYSYTRRSFDPEAFQSFLATASDRNRLGIAGEYENNTSQKLVGLALASQSHVFILDLLDEVGVGNGESQMSLSSGQTQTARFVDLEDSEQDDDSDEECNRQLDEDAYEKCREAIEAVLTSTEWTLLGFNMDRLALSLFVTLGWRICQVVDLQSTMDAEWNYPRDAVETYENLLGGKEVVKPGKLMPLFESEGRDTSVLYKARVQGLVGLSLPVLQRFRCPPP